MSMQAFGQSDNIDLVQHAGAFAAVSAGDAPAPLRVYIAGPMTGIPNHNFPTFRKAACDLNCRGYHAVSPLEINNEQDGAPGEWAECMKRDIAALMTCDAVALLDGWQRSRGALLEHFIAQTVGIACRSIDHFLQPATGRPPATPL